MTIDNRHDMKISAYISRIKYDGIDIVRLVSKKPLKLIKIRRK